MTVILFYVFYTMMAFWAVTATVLSIMKKRLSIKCYACWFVSIIGELVFLFDLKNQGGEINCVFNLILCLIICISIIIDFYIDAKRAIERKRKNNRW